MASPSILRAGVRSPIHALMKPASTRSILKKPAPLPLSPKPLAFASFSVVINSPRPSPHVHFPLSPAMAATFSAYSPNTYDRGPIIISPESPGLSGWATRQLSPSANNAFKLLAPPNKRKAQAQGPAHNPRLLTVPAFEDPRSPKPYQEVHKTPVATHNPRLLTIPAFEDPRSPKPYKEVYKTSATTEKTQLLSVPTIEDPRSPKPYKPRAGVTFQDLTLHVPRGIRGADELGKALSTYPRSPYPSAPIEDGMDNDTNINIDIDVDNSEAPERGRWPTKSGKPSRARSLEKEPKTRHCPNLVQVASPLRQSFLSPVTESTPAKAKAKSTPAPLDLETQFWESVTLEEPEPESESAYVTANEVPESASLSVSLSSPAVNIMFGSKDGQLWSPRVPTRRKKVQDRDGSLLSPAHWQRQRKAFSKGMVASPSPKDPFAAFPSFTVAMMSGMDRNIAYPPPARVVREM